MVRQFFAAVGVDLNTNNPANSGKMFVCNDRKGILTGALHRRRIWTSLMPPSRRSTKLRPEINIKAKFIEITQNDHRGLGFNWSLGNTSMGGTVAVRRHATQLQWRPHHGQSGRHLSRLSLFSEPLFFPASDRWLPDARRLAQLRLGTIRRCRPRLARSPAS